MKELKEFLYENKVFLSGLLGAILLTLQQFIGADTIEWKGIAFAAIIAALSYLAKNLRGQVASMAGIVLTVFMQYVEMNQSDVVNWEQLLMQLAILLGGIFAPPAKSRGYEHTEMIQNAKFSGEQLVKSVASPNPPTEFDTTTSTPKP
jgi:hypothetical protein